MGKGGQGLTYATEGRDLNGLIRNGIGDMDNIYCVLTMYQLHSEACIITFNPHNDLLRRILYCPDFTDKKVSAEIVTCPRSTVGSVASHIRCPRVGTRLCVKRMNDKVGSDLTLVVPIPWAFEEWGLLA